MVNIFKSELTNLITQLVFYTIYIILVFFVFDVSTWLKIAFLIIFSFGAFASIRKYIYIKINKQLNNKPE